MPYVAVKGGEKAIENAEALLKSLRRGDTNIEELSLEQIQQQLSLAVNRVMAEGSLYDEELAALAIKQSWGDLVEAIFLLRAYRTTLPRFYYSEPIDTGKMRIKRRISAIFKDLPGGQCLGPTFDYVHRLLDFKLLAEGEVSTAPESEANSESTPRVVDALNHEGLIEAETQSCSDNSASQPYDITRQPMNFPVSRDARLQNLARADEGFLLSMAYSTQRGYGRNHPFAGEIRMGDVDVIISPPELGFDVVIGEITVSEVQMVNQFKGSKDVPAQFSGGYGLTFGYNERKAMSMALVDRAMRAEELDETIESPAQDIEFVMSHSDNIEAQGFVQHLKLPHYIDFQAELNLVRKMRQDALNRNSEDKLKNDSVCQDSEETKNTNKPEKLLLTVEDKK